MQMDSGPCPRKVCLLLLSVLALVLSNGAPSRAQEKVYDVTSFGAVANGKTDNSKVKEPLEPHLATCSLGEHEERMESGARAGESPRGLFVKYRKI